VFVPGTALASPTYPGVIQTFLKQNGYPNAPLPPCTICHRDMNGQKGTVIRPFGVYLHEQQGLVAGEDDTLRHLLGKLDGHNTDGDPFTDIQELGMGWDPNVKNLSDGGIDPNAANQTMEQVTQEYGCSVVPSSRTVSGAASALLGFVGLTWLVRRRPREEQKHHRHEK
jgi:hypothetical protein